MNLKNDGELLRRHDSDTNSLLEPRVHGGLVVSPRFLSLFPDVYDQGLHPVVDAAFPEELLGGV